MLKTDVKRALYLAEAGAELCGTILSGVIPSLILFAQALLLLSLVALALIGLRILLIDIAPTLARSSKTVAAAINIFMDVFAILIEYIKLAIYGKKYLPLKKKEPHQRVAYAFPSPFCLP